MSKDLEFLIKLVKDASSLITDELQIKAKGNKGDLVTNFDFEIEKYIIDKIKENYPGFNIISEEYNSENKLTNNCFTIDPIDGTINFANDIPLWGIQVACIRDGKTVAAVIYLPKLKELYSADEKGAFLNGDPIKVNKLDITHGIYNIEGPKQLPGQVKMSKISIHSRSFFCSAVNFAWTACGRLSGTIFLKDTFWDYIPGQFIVEKAGGVIHNDEGVHIAANNKEFLNMLKDNAIFDKNKKVEVVYKDK